MAVAIWSGITKDRVSVDLETFHVAATYASLLEGVPNAGMNQRLVAEAVAKARSLVCCWPVYLAEPCCLFRDFAPDLVAAGWEQKYPQLPEFRCIGAFTSGQTRDDENHGSTLAIVWFQDRSPVEGIDLQLGDLDWFAHALDFRQ